MKHQRKGLRVAMAAMCLFFSFATTLAQNFKYAKGFTNSTILGGNLSGRSITVDANGNMYVMGLFTATADFDPGPGVANLSSQGGNDIFVAKYDASGNYVYAKALGSTANDVVGGIAVDGTGNVYITGHSSGVIDFDPGPGVVNQPAGGGDDVFIAKYDVSGNYVYAKVLKGPSTENAAGIVADAAGNIYITGNFGESMDFNPGTGTAILTNATARHEVYFAKYDASGNYVFAKSVGGDNPDYGYGIALDGAGNIYITGTFYGTADFDPSAATATLTSSGTTDIFFAKYTATGGYVYAKAIGGTTGETPSAIAADAAGNVYLTGYFQGTADLNPAAAVTSNLTSAGGNDAFFACYDALGNYVYANRLGSNLHDVSNSIAVDASGNAYVTGYFTGTVDLDAGAGTANYTSVGSSYDMFLVKYNPSGAYVYGKVISSATSDDAYDVALDLSGNVYTTGRYQATVDFDPDGGTINLSTPTSTANAYVLRLSSTGAYSLVYSMGGYPATSFNDVGRAIATDASGNVYLTGSFSGTVDFDPGPGLGNVTSAAGNDIFLAKYDALGNFLWAKSMGGAGSDNGAGIAVDGAGYIYLTGSFSGTVDFDPSAAGTANLTSAGGTDAYFAKYDALGNFIFAKNVGGTSGDNGLAIALDPSGNLCILGAYYSTSADLDPGAGVANLAGNGTGDIFLGKYDALGNYLWAWGINGSSFKQGNGLAIDALGNIYVTGYFQGTVDFDPGTNPATLISAGSNDIFVAKYDAGGNYVFAKAMGGTSNENGVGIALDGNANIYITGFFQGTADLDPGASTNNLASAGANDIFLAKYDAAGNFLWAKSMGGTAADNGVAVTVTNAGDAFVTGYYNGTADFDAGTGVLNLTSMGNADIFLVNYDAAGNFVYARTMGGAAADNGNAIVLDPRGNALITGMFTASADFDPSAGSPISILNGINGNDVFVASFGPASTLPVTWLGVSAQVIQNENAVQINWQTASEAGNHHFDVERSRDGRHFEVIGRQQGCTFCTSGQSYHFIDNTPYEGLAYYRIKQEDAGGQRSYSTIVLLNRDTKNKETITAYPTITSDRCTLAIKNNPAAKTVLVQVVGTAGSLLQQQKFSLRKGENTLEVKLGDLPAGLYYIQVRDKTQKATTLKVIKK